MVQTGIASERRLWIRIYCGIAIREAILCRQWMLWHGRVSIPANELQSNNSAWPQVQHSTMFNRSNAVSMRDDAAANTGISGPLGLK